MGIPLTAPRADDPGMTRTAEDGHPPARWSAFTRLAAGTTLLGLAVGDGLGGKFEAQPAESIRARFRDSAALFEYPAEEIWYTDDTQMAIGVAETLVAHGRIDDDALCAAFAANYVAERGYGRGARAVLEAMLEGRDHRAVAERYFPGGSYGNGAAMRVAPRR